MNIDMRRFAGSALLLFLVVTPASATIWTVGGAGPNFLTIQDAVNASSPGDTIVVRAGTYNEAVIIQGHEDLHLVAAEFPGASPLIGAMAIGAGSPVASTVVIDGSGLGQSCLTIEDSHRISIFGFQIENCDVIGIHVLASGQSPEDIWIEGNRIQSTVDAGVLLDAAVRARVVGNTIDSSFGSTGVILRCKYCTVADNLITNHIDAGILVIMPSYETHLVNNEVLFNSGGGIFDFAERTRIERNQSLGNGYANLYVGSTSMQADVSGNRTNNLMILLGAGLDFSDSQ